MAYVNRYHGNEEVPWRRNFDYGAKKKLVGIEFEHEFSSHDPRGNANVRNDIVGDVETNVNSQRYSWLAERDGSLNEVRGIEFVSNPMTYSYVFRKDGIFHKLVDTLEKHGTDYDNPNVGLHVNLNMSWLSKEKQRQVLHFLNQCRIGKEIGGRDSHYGRIGVEYMTYDNLRTGIEGGKMTAAWIPGGYCEDKSTRMEVRSARSSTNWAAAARRVLYPISAMNFISQLKDDIFHETLKTQIGWKKLEAMYLHYILQKPSKGLLKDLREFIIAAKPDVKERIAKLPTLDYLIPQEGIVRIVNA